MLVEVDTVEITPTGVLCRGMSYPRSGTIRVQFAGGEDEVKMTQVVHGGTFWQDVPTGAITVIDPEVA